MKPLRIASIANVPWDVRLGAARVWMELGAEWQRAGHSVTKFCLDDAFSGPAPSGVLAAMRLLQFPRRAAAWLRAHRGQFDVIDSLLGTVPFTKRSLGFNGLLVARSVGLFHVYDEFSRRTRTPRRLRPSSLLFETFHALDRRASRRSLEMADLLNLPNTDEARVVRDELQCGTASIVQPYGLTDEQLEWLARAAAPAAARLATKCVCFVGMWSPRKGARDWAAIIRNIRSRVPGARFRFVGTMTANETVLRDLDLSDAAGIEIVPQYQPDELPQLLGDCAVGAFPSYVEGFGLALLEQLAAGIPTVSYSSSGPREILDPALSELLTPIGDASAFSERVADLLSAEEQRYAVLSTRCRELARRFTWSTIAAATARHYAEQLAPL